MELIEVNKKEKKMTIELICGFLVGVIAMYITMYIRYKDVDNKLRDSLTKVKLLKDQLTKVEKRKNWNPYGKRKNGSRRNKQKAQKSE